MKVRKATLIPRDDGKRIEEWVGAVNTRTDSVSVARMLAPPGWREPPQTPEFDEVVVVLTGCLTLMRGRQRERIRAGEVGLVPAGTRVVYRNDERGACDYYSICAPAFRPQLAHMEPSEGPRVNNVVQVEGKGARARAHRAWIQREARRFLAALELSNCELSVALVGDAQIHRLNRQWRGKDKATDVLSFPAGDTPRGAPGPRPLGDVIISLDTAQRASREFDRTLKEELRRYLAHGVLHLLGYDHQHSADARRMAAEEEKLLGGRGMVPISPPAAGRRG